MPELPEHRRLVADAFRVPRPFRAFAVRSDEPAHAWDARAPYGTVHVVRCAGLDEVTRAQLAAEAFRRVALAAFVDIGYACTDAGDLAATVPDAGGLLGGIADALRPTGVLGAEATAADYRRGVATRVDYLACCGAGFHNDVGRHWSRCLFWLLVLAASEVDFVMPHAGLRLAIAPGDLLVFDPALAHGLCRPGDDGQALAASFEDGGERSRQAFLTGELPLSDAQWAALGLPWLPVEVHDGLGALDLMVAEFDERSGAIQRPQALRDGMKRSTCHVDGPVA